VASRDRQKEWEPSGSELKKTDIWATGIVTYAMLTGEYPLPQFEDKELAGLKQLLEHAHHPHVWQRAAQKGRELLPNLAGICKDVLDLHPHRGTKEQFEFRKVVYESWDDFLKEVEDRELPYGTPLFLLDKYADSTSDLPLPELIRQSWDWPDSAPPEAVLAILRDIVNEEHKQAEIKKVKALKRLRARDGINLSEIFGGRFRGVFPEVAVNMVHRMTHWDFKERLSARDALGHEWVRDVKVPAPLPHWGPEQPPGAAFQAPQPPHFHVEIMGLPGPRGKQKPLPPKYVSAPLHSSMPLHPASPEPCPKAKGA